MKETYTENQPMAGHSLTRSEVGPVLTVSVIVALRLLGMFLILPIFSVYVLRYPGATLPLAGIAFGVYALTQSLLQVPMGWASDRWGRKPLILFGLALFSGGGIACGLARNITQLIIARAVQGSGAIGAVALATLADQTRSQVRAQAFTITGIAIGGSFMVGLLAGPVLAAHLGFSELFYLLGLMGAAAMAVAVWLLPSVKPQREKQSEQSFRFVWQNPELRLIYLASFVLSFALNLFFFNYPLSWVSMGLERGQLWKVYLIIFAPSVFLAFPAVRFAERLGRLRPLSQFSWWFLAIGYLAYLIGPAQKSLLYLSGGSFFLGYTMFQPLLPSFLTQRVSSEGRGSATGFYNFSGFMGNALGGMLAGELGHLGHSIPQIAGLLVLLLWPLRGLPNPPESPM